MQCFSNICRNFDDDVNLLLLRCKLLHTMRRYMVAMSLYSGSGAFSRSREWPTRKSGPLGSVKSVIGSRVGMFYVF